MKAESRQYPESLDEGIVEGNPAAKKSVVVCLLGSYPKPTQVGEESILRCSSESWLRN